MTETNIFYETGDIQLVHAKLLWFLSIVKERWMKG